MSRAEAEGATGSVVSTGACATAHADATRWQMLFEQSPQSMQVFAPDGSTRRVNAAWRRLFRSDASLAAQFNVLTDPQLEAAGVADHVRAAFQGDVVQVPPIPFLIHPTTGTEVRWIGAVFFPVFDGNGELTEVVCVHEDITERRQAELTVRESQQLLDSVTRSVSEAIYRATPAGRLSYVNDSYLRLFGYESLEQLNAIPRERLYARPADRAQLLQWLAQSDGFRNQEIEFRRRDGTTFWASISSRAHRDPESRAILWFDGVISDVTDRRRAEQAVRDLNATLEARVLARTSELEHANARLTAEVAERERREAMLRAVWEMSEAVHTAEDLEQLFARIHGIICTLMRAPNFYLALYDAATSMISFPYYSDERSPIPGNRCCANGLTEYVLRTRRPLLASRGQVQALMGRGEVAPQGDLAAVWLGVPLLVGGLPIGVMVVQDYVDEHAFREDDQQLLNFVAAQTALAIDRKRTAWIRARRERIQVATWQISEAVHSARDLDQLYARIHEIVGTLMPAGNFYLLLRDAETGLDHTVYWRDEMDPAPPPQRLRRGMTAYVLRTGRPLRATRAQMLRPAPAGCVEVEGDTWYLEAGTASAVWLGIPLRLDQEVFGVMAVQDYRDERAYGDDEQQILTFVAEQIALAIQRKRAEAELIHALERERQLGQLRKDFVSMVSHEFRTPLGIISSSAGLLEKHHDRLDPEERIEQLGSIRANVRRMSRLMEEVLLFGRVEEGRLGCEPRPVQPRLLLGVIADELKSATDQRCPIQLHLEALPETLAIDERLLRPVVANLVVNAVKYSEPGKPVELSAEVRQGVLLLVVRDQGCGIPAADLPKLFEPFRRGSNVSHVPGTGLGLAIVRRCVRLHGGTLDLTSEVGTGTCVQIRIPLTEAGSPASTPL
ncbi:MAG: GAF domain-containing protein [Verrucomicrobiales bacterium]|nr:GAF domain-containing protein [Verrucomicrobiales bacterium]